MDDDLTRNPSFRSLAVYLSTTVFALILLTCGVCHVVGDRDLSAAAITTRDRYCRLTSPEVRLALYLDAI